VTAARLGQATKGSALVGGFNPVRRFPAHASLAAPAGGADDVAQRRVHAAYERQLHAGGAGRQAERRAAGRGELCVCSRPLRLAWASRAVALQPFHVAGTSGSHVPEEGDEGGLAPVTRRVTRGRSWQCLLVAATGLGLKPERPPWYAGASRRRRRSSTPVSCAASSSSSASSRPRCVAAHVLACRATATARQQLRTRYSTEQPAACTHVGALHREAGPSSHVCVAVCYTHTSARP
jgi:hypothetical protein